MESWLSLVLLAVLLDATIQAVGAQGLADISPVKQDPVMGLETQFLRNVSCEVPLHIIGCLALGEAQTM